MGIENIKACLDQAHALSEKIGDLVTQENPMVAALAITTCMEVMRELFPDAVHLALEMWKEFQSSPHFPPHAGAEFDS